MSFRFISITLLVMFVFIAFHFAMKADEAKLCSNDETAYEGC